MCVRGQQHLFSTHEWMLLIKLWDRKSLDGPGGGAGEYSTISASGPDIIKKGKHGCCDKNDFKLSDRRSIPFGRTSSHWSVVALWSLCQIENVMTTSTSMCKRMVPAFLAKKIKHYLERDLTYNPTWIIKLICCKVWDEDTYPFPNVNDYTIDFWEWIHNLCTHFIFHPRQQIPLDRHQFKRRTYV